MGNNSHHSHPLEGVGFIGVSTVVFCFLIFEKTEIQDTLKWV